MLSTLSTETPCTPHRPSTVTNKMYVPCQMGFFLSPANQFCCPVTRRLLTRPEAGKCPPGSVWLPRAHWDRPTDLLRAVQGHCGFLGTL